MTEKDLLNHLKNALLIPESITDFDEILNDFLLGSKAYIDSMLDIQPDLSDKLYCLVILFYSEYNYLNRDNPKLKNFPVSLNALLNRLKTKYHD